MKSELEIRAEYDETLDIYGHSPFMSNKKKMELITKIELLEWILDIKASDLLVVR
jgi:hypothetical protein